MPVNKRDQKIEQHLPFIKKVRDVIAGQETIKSSENIETYLPKRSKQKEKHYTIYCNTPYFLEATARTRDALSSIINRKKPVVECSASIEETLKKITKSGGNIQLFAEEVVFELMTTGLHITIIDRGINGNIFTTNYNIEDLFHYEYYDNNGTQELQQIVIREEYKEASEKDEFIKVVKEQYREYRLIYNKETKSKEVAVNIWRNGKNKNKKKYIVVEKKQLTIGQKILDFIPVVITGLDSQQLIRKPILAGLVNLNLSHFISEANHEEILYWASAPIISINTEANGINLSPGNVTVLPSEGELKIHEVTGNGAKAIREKIKDKEEMMASMGAGIISEKTSAGTNISVAKMYQANANASLLGISNTASSGLTKIIKIISAWEEEAKDKTNKTSISINTDFISSKAAPDELKAWLELYLKGGMSQETLLYNMQQGEMYKPNTEIQDEIDLIEAGQTTQEMEQ